MFLLTILQSMDCMIHMRGTKFFFHDPEPYHRSSFTECAIIDVDGLAYENESHHWQVFYTENNQTHPSRTWHCHSRGRILLLLCLLGANTSKWDQLALVRVLTKSWVPRLMFITNSTHPFLLGCSSSFPLYPALSEYVEQDDKILTDGCFHQTRRISINCNIVLAQFLG
jgi:hypothetical protein